MNERIPNHWLHWNWYSNLSQFLSTKWIENEFNIRELKLIYCLRCLVNQLLLLAEIYIIDQITSTLLSTSTLSQIAFIAETTTATTTISKNQFSFTSILLPPALFHSCWRRYFSIEATIIITSMSTALLYEIYLPISHNCNNFEK